MNYDIFSRTAPAMPRPGKGTEIVKLLLSQVSKGMQEPLFLMFSLYFAHMRAARNFSIPTSFGGYFVAKWPVWWKKVGVKRTSNTLRDCVKHAGSLSQNRSEAQDRPHRTSETSGSYKIFRKRVIIPVFIRSANMAPMMGTMRKGLTV